MPISFLNMGPWPVEVGYTSCPHEYEKATGVSVKDVDGEAMLLPQVSPVQVVIFITNDTTLSPLDRVGLMAHEAMHVVHFMQETLNDGDALGEEAEAYIIQYLMMWLSKESGLVTC